MSFFNSSAFAIMLKPLLSQYLEPLEANGTIAKLQADIEMLSKEGALPALHELVSEMKAHNALLREIADGMKADEYGSHLPDFGSSRIVSGPDTGTTGLIGNNGIRVFGSIGTD